MSCQAAYSLIPDRAPNEASGARLAHPSFWSGRVLVLTGIGRPSTDSWYSHLLQSSSATLQLSENGAVAPWAQTNPICKACKGSSKDRHSCDANRCPSQQIRQEQKPFLLTRNVQADLLQDALRHHSCYPTGADGQPGHLPAVTATKRQSSTIESL